MQSRDRAYLAQALARAAVQPGVSAATTEQCIYQIGLVLAREARRFDLGAWQRKIREWRVALLASPVSDSEATPMPERSLVEGKRPGHPG